MVLFQKVDSGLVVVTLFSFFHLSFGTFLLAGPFFLSALVRSLKEKPGDIQESLARCGILARTNPWFYPEKWWFYPKKISFD